MKLDKNNIIFFTTVKNMDIELKKLINLYLFRVKFGAAVILIILFLLFSFSHFFIGDIIMINVKYLLIGLLILMVLLFFIKKFQDRYFIKKTLRTRIKFYLTRVESIMESTDFSDDIKRKFICNNKEILIKEITDICSVDKEKVKETLESGSYKQLIST